MDSLDSKNVTALLNPATGLIELMEITTGRLIAIQKNTGDYLTERREQLVEHRLPTGEIVLLEKGLKLSEEFIGGPRFNQLAVDLLCQKIAEGGYITKICTEAGMPSYSVLCQWKRLHKHINEQIDQAYRDRAECLRDKVLIEADKAQEDTINESRVKIDALKWAAGVDSPKFSPKAKVEATFLAPTQIIVHTGIDRTPLPESNRPVEELHNGECKDETSAGGTKSSGFGGDTRTFGGGEQISHPSNDPS